jgi:hypothetical protein
MLHLRRQRMNRNWSMAVCPLAAPVCLSRSIGLQLKNFHIPAASEWLVKLIFHPPVTLCRRRI